MAEPWSLPYTLLDPPLFVLEVELLLELEVGAP